MCGEHLFSRPFVMFNRGSSPHVRGARLGTAIGGVFTGIIPACAGSTFGPTRLVLETGDHPRMCGEHTSKTA